MAQGMNIAQTAQQQSSRTTQEQLAKSIKEINSFKTDALTNFSNNQKNMESLSAISKQQVENPNLRPTEKAPTLS